MYEGSLCVCCMSTEDLVQLFGSGSEGVGEADYARMMAVCLRIPLSEADGHDSICMLCVNKLKDCLSFKVMTVKSISILSSVDFTELLTEEELQVLDLNKTEQCPKLKPLKDYDATEPETSSVQNVPKLRKTKTKMKKLKPKLANGDTDVEDVENKENTAASPARGVGGGGRRRRGRPRVHSPDGLPYTLDRTERACRECKKVFPNHITLKVHYNTHFGRHACEQCSKRFVSRIGLAKHANAHQEGPFRCDKCSQEFSKINTLLSHKRFKHGAREAYRCGVCPQRFRTLHARYTHRATAHGENERAYECRYCGETFRYSGQRNKHVSTHHEIRFAECGECGALLRRSSLLDHLRRHSGEGKRRGAARFACRLCGAAFSQKHSLQYHLGAHARRGEPPGPLPPLQQLVVDRARERKDRGLLSDVASEELSELAASDLTDHTQSSLGGVPDLDETQYIHCRSSSDDERSAMKPASNGRRDSRDEEPASSGRRDVVAHEFRIDLDFISRNYEE